MLELANLIDGDSVRYRIIVTDSSSNSNQTILPEEGFYAIYIDGLYDPVKIYTNDFNEVSRNFISAEFYIGTEDLFDDGALHSPHPYPSPEEDDKTFDFIALLKSPVILDDRAMMSYREVVFVEPGEDGSVYGDDDFWDYAIVEGSKNGIDNWLPLIDGYDSQDSNSWLLNYNLSIQGNNSTTVGKESHYVSREFKMTGNGNFQEGDTIFIRFRLFSDPYAHGWGWAIDDLIIQYPPTSIANLKYSPGEIIVFPNPVSNSLYVRGRFKTQVGQVNVSVLNGFGQLLSKETVVVEASKFNHTVNVHSLQSGLYLIAFEFDNGQMISRKFVKQ